MHFSPATDSAWEQLYTRGAEATVPISGTLLLMISRGRFKKHETRKLREAIDAALEGEPEPGEDERMRLMRRKQRRRVEGQPRELEKEWP